MVLAMRQNSRRLLFSFGDFSMGAVSGMGTTLGPYLARDMRARLLTMTDADFPLQLEKDGIFRIAVGPVGADAELEAGKGFPLFCQGQVHGRTVELEGGGDVFRDVAFAVGIRDDKGLQIMPDLGNQARVDDELLLETLDDHVLGTFSAGTERLARRSGRQRGRRRGRGRSGRSRQRATQLRRRRTGGRTFDSTGSGMAAEKRRVKSEKMGNFVTTGHEKANPVNTIFLRFGAPEGKIKFHQFRRI